jgi:DNA repair and recombination protein RAD52
MDQSSPPLHPSARGPQQPPPMNHDGSFHNNALAFDMIESATLSSYEPPSCFPPPKAKIHWVYNPSDGSVLCDHKGQPISVDKILATKPLRHELSTRPGPGNKKLTYISGEGVSRTLNDIFGFDGWNLDTTKVQREECLKDATTGKYNVVYTAMVRLTHKASGAYKEDCGAGDSSDKNFGTAVSHALKASITDAMKRAARHFGDKLGNCKFGFNSSGTWNLERVSSFLMAAN